MNQYKTYNKAAQANTCKLWLNGNVIRIGYVMAFPVDEKYIKKAETELGVRFPDSFREKMMQMNGGSVDVSTDYFDLHPFYDTSDKKRIKRTCGSIVHETKIARRDYRLPENLIFKQDIYLYKYWASFDGKTWVNSHKLMNVEPSGGFDMSGGKIEVKLDI